MICNSSKYNRHEKQEGENERMNDNFNNDKWTEKAVWIKKEPLSSDAVLGEVAPLTKEKLLEKTLMAVLKRWKYDADQGDGIHETDYRLYNRAMKLIDPDYEPL